MTWTPQELALLRRFDRNLDAENQRKKPENPNARKGPRTSAKRRRLGFHKTNGGRWYKNKKASEQ
jgi:hypothetical protein